MGYRKIVTIDGDEAFLRKKCRRVEAFDAKLAALLDDMKETLYAAHGAGLAAPQVGILRRAAVVVPDGEHYVELVNPEIVEVSEEQIGPEACLSVPGQQRVVRRPRVCTVRAQDRQGNFFTLTAEDFFCRAVLHECDHLDGILYLDKAEQGGEEQ